MYEQDEKHGVGITDGIGFLLAEAVYWNNSDKMVSLYEYPENGKTVYNVTLWTISENSGIGQLFIDYDKAVEKFITTAFNVSL